MRYFVPRLTAALQALYGDAGGGWCGLSYPNAETRRGGSANSNRLYQAGHGNWITEINRRPVPDICTAVSTTPGDSIRVTLVDGPTRGVTLHFIPGGAIDYRWNDGAWMRLDLAEEARASPVSLAGFPSAGGWTLDMRVARGTVELAGIVHDSGLPGIVVHNLGAGGSCTQHWTAVDARMWTAAVTSLKVNAAFMLFGTNDQKLISPHEHGDCLSALVERFRLAAPEAELVLVTSPESGDTRSPRPERPMRQYSELDHTIAANSGSGHIDLQTVFGQVDTYRYGGTQPLLDSSLLHPAPAAMRLLETFFFDLLSVRES